MRKKIGWWVPEPGVHAVVKRIAKPVRNHVFRWVRELRGLERKEVADRLGLKVSTIEALEQGKYVTSEDNLERLVASLGISPGTLEDFVALAEEIRGEQMLEDQWLGPVRISGQRLRRAREFGRDFGNVEGRRFIDDILRTWVEEDSAKDRETAVHIGHHLRQKKNVVEFVRQDKGCQLWSVAELLCNESLNVIVKDRDRAAEMVEAALVVAELAPCGEKFRERLKGLVWGHAANIRRVKNEFEGADAAFGKSSMLWREGASGDPYGLLEVGRLLGMESSLRREQGRFAEALCLLREALPVATKGYRPYLQVKYGMVLVQMGDAESAIRVLEDAVKEAPPNLLLSARFRLGVALCHLGRYEEAEALLPEVARLCLETGSKDYGLRVKWLRGRVALGLDKSEEAEEIFNTVRKGFLELGCVYDAAIVVLDLAKIYLARGETATVKRVAEEMEPLFAGRGLHSFAQEALRLFQAAATREVVSIELTGRVLNYLERARHAQGLRFEAAAAA